MIQIIKWQTGVPSIDKSETLRYMGVRARITPELEALSEKGIRRVTDTAVCRGCYARVPVETLNEAHLTIAGESIESHHLARLLRECNEVFLMAATVGVQVDRLIRATASISPAECLAIDAAGSAAVEWVCDKLNEHLLQLANTEGKTLCKRFSPGYGDVPLEYQKSMSKLLNLPLNLGITLSDSLMMFPTKSVTAIIGIKNRKE